MFGYFIFRWKYVDHICRQQAVFFCFLTIGVSRSKSILRISVAGVFSFFGFDFAFRLGEMPRRNRIGACGVAVPLGFSKSPPVRSMT